MDTSDFDSSDFDPAPRTAAELPPTARLRALADSLECLLRGDVSEIADVKPSTTDAWAKRGEGPPYVMFGNRRLYPLEGVRKYLQERMRGRGVSVASLL